MNKAFALIAVATLSALPIIAQSACTRADLTGTWRLYTVFDSPWLLHVGDAKLRQDSHGCVVLLFAWGGQLNAAKRHAHH